MRVLAEEARAIGADALVLYVVDYEQNWLVPVPGPHAAGREALSIQGTMAGRAFATSSIVESRPTAASGRRLWLPLLDGTERLGAMEITFPGAEQSLPEATPGRMRALCPPRRHPDRDEEHVQRLLRARAATAADDDGQRAAVGAGPAAGAGRRRLRARGLVGAVLRHRRRRLRLRAQRRRPAPRGVRRHGPRPRRRRASPRSPCRRTGTAVATATRARGQPTWLSTGARSTSTRSPAAL